MSAMVHGLDTLDLLKRLLDRWAEVYVRNAAGQLIPLFPSYEPEIVELRRDAVSAALDLGSEHLKIIEAIAEGMTDEEIPRRVSLSENQVDTRRDRIADATGLNRRVTFASFFSSLGMIAPGQILALSGSSKPRRLADRMIQSGKTDIQSRGQGSAVLRARDSR